MEDYFATSEPSSAWNHQPFIAEINDNEQPSGIAEFSSCKDQVSFSSLIEFWCSMLQEYPELAKESSRKH